MSVPFYRPWVDSFAAARNDSLCLPDPQTKSATVVDHIRLFRNRPEVRWQYRVHEQILKSIRVTKGDVRWSDVEIQHVGYQDSALRRRKLERDLRLLRMDDEQNPDDPFILFNLGSVFQELGQLRESIPVLRRSLERSHPTDSIVRKLYAMLAQSHRHLGEKELALAACRKGREFYPDDIELLHLEGQVSLALGDAAGAEACWGADLGQGIGVERGDVAVLFIGERFGDGGDGHVIPWSMGFRVIWFLDGESRLVSCRGDDP